MPLELTSNGRPQKSTRRARFFHRLTVEQAIRAQTIDAAYQLFADDVVGSLEVGKYADMVVLSTDPRAVPPEEIAGLEVRATFLAGAQVYGTL